MRRWRKMTWVLVAWTGLWAVLVVVAVVGVLSKTCGDDSDVLGAAFSGDTTCIEIALRGKGEVATDHAAGRIAVWLVGLVLLAAVWALTREKKRTCPHCGNEVEKGRTTCANCGYDFTIGRNPAHAAAATPVAATAAPTTPPPAWYDDAERPGHRRWWDGTAWGVRDDEAPQAGWAGQEGGT